MNYYELLEVSPKASPAVIRAAYKSLMQRYHPDKQPDDLKVAEMATLLTQAFEVLSDDLKRAAYDRKLKEDARRRAARSRVPTPKAEPLPRTAPARRAAGLLSVAALVALAAGWWLAAPQQQPTAAESPAPTGAVRPRPATVSRDVAKLLGDVSVTLHEREPGSDRRRILLIPSLGVRVGARDPEGAARHLSNTADALWEKLQADLAAARYEELIKPDGERYLAEIILTTVRNTTGTPESSAAPGETESGERYGPVEILLPQSFSVR